MASEDLGIFKNLNTELLKKAVIIIEMSWLLFMAVLYLQFPGTFSLLSLILLVAHLITVIGLPSIFSKLNKERQEDTLHFAGAEEQDEDLNGIDLWDRALVGFYVVTNACVFLFLFVTMFL